jgi:hypothetical protein
MNFENAIPPVNEIENLKITSEVPLAINLPCQNVLLVGATFLDGKNMKNFFTYLSKLHTNISLEFYKNGIWGIQKREDPKNNQGQSLEAISSIHFPGNKLIDYTINLKPLPGYKPVDEDKICFTLLFDVTALTPFFDGISADSAIALSYVYGNNVMFFVNLDGGSPYPIPVTFGLIPTPFPISGPIAEVNFIPSCNAKAVMFSANAAKLTKVKDQLIHNMFIDVQIIGPFNKAAILVHSTERKWHKEFGPYDMSRPPDISFNIKSEIIKALGFISKINEKGFLEILFINDSMIRIQTQIGNFGKYNLYIVPKRKTG